MESRNQVQDVRNALVGLSPDKLAKLIELLGESSPIPEVEAETTEVWCHFTYGPTMDSKALIATIRCSRGYTSLNGTLAFRGTGRNDATIDGKRVRVTLNGQMYVEGSQSESGKAQAEAKRAEREAKRTEWENKQLEKAKAILAKRENAK